jgi:AcrR family transcriptional regulator
MPAKYHSPLRQRQAAQTRTMVLEAAIHVFAERGWTGTTLAAIAEEAGTAVETIYSAFGSKANLLIAAIDTAIAGDDRDARLDERAQFAALGTGSKRQRVKVAAEIITRALQGAVPLMRALQEAAGSDAQARQRWERYEVDRRLTVSAGLELIVGDRPASELVDSIWALTGPEVFTKLTLECGWTVDRYQSWLEHTGLALLGSVRP